MHKQTIKISKKKDILYSKTLELIYSLITLWQNVRDTSDDINHEKVYNRIVEMIDETIKDKLTFNEFITDLKDESEIVEIDTEIYEKYIRAQQVIKSINLAKTLTNDILYKLQSIIISIVSFK